MLRRLSIVVTGLFLSLSLASSAFGQAGRATIDGTVFDQDKAVMPGVNVTVTEENTGLQRTTVTGEQGRFIVPTLVPGMYTVSAELQGFQTAIQTGLRLAVGQELTVNLTLSLAGIAENLTVTAQAPIVEVTTNRLGSNISNAEIDSLPSAGRNQLSLMQMVPGLIPSLNPGDFEGGQFNSGGQATNANVFLVDGAYNNDDRRGGSQGTQASVALDAMAEYQVLTHQYSAEYGGGAGVVVNSVSRSGTNNFSGRVFEYFKDNKLDATEYFLAQAGEESPDYGSNVFGGNIGGPIVRNKAFFFFNIERTLRKDAASIRFPDSAPASLGASNYATTQDFNVMNTFTRGDVQVSSSNNLSVRWLRAKEVTERDTLIGSRQTPSNWRHENDAGDQVLSVAFTSILGNNATNEVKFGHTRETLLQGGVVVFDDDLNFIDFETADQFFVGSQNTHPDYVAGPHTAYQTDPLRAYTIDNAFTLLKTGWGGDHTFKVGGGYSKNGTSNEGQGTAANYNGTFNFSTNQAFDPANPFTYPRQFTVRVLGQRNFVQQDKRANFYVQDKWQVNRQLTLNVGVRYDWQDILPETKDAFAPRLGFAYDPTGGGSTVIRAGLGKFYSLQPVSIVGTFLQNALISPVNQFTTGAQINPPPSTTGVIPAHPCLQPDGNNGLAVISAGCRAVLEGIRAGLAAGTFINPSPQFRGDIRMPYIWAWSAGIKRQLIPDLALSVDYVANVGRDQSTQLDINVGPTNPATGRITRLGANGFDPNGELVPLDNAAARGTNFLRVLQYVTDDRFDSDFKSLEVSLEKRMSNRWSARLSYTLSYANNVGTSFVDNLDPRRDYGRANVDNRHALAAGGNVDVWRGLGAGFIFRAYSGNPINETIGNDANGDLVNNDRPVQGVHDAAFPIRSALDANGMAVRNGIDGEKTVLLDGRIQYVWEVRGMSAGLYIELYNLLNTANFGNPEGDRSSDTFMVPDEVGAPRSMQLGIRFDF